MLEAKRTVAGSTVKRGVCTHLDRSFQFQQYRLGDEYLAGLLAQVTNFGFKKLNLLSWSTPSHFEEPVDDGI